MNKLEILVGNDYNSLFEQSIKYIGNFLNDINKQNIIIVPDKLSLLTEQKIFEILGIDVYFNISVMGISKFVNSIINSNGLKLLECTSSQAKLITLKAIQNVKDNFKCFTKNYTLGLVDEIFAKIEQIKSSNAKIDDLIDENASEGTKLKFQDIKLIYNEYERLRGDRMDSGAVLSLFNNICKDSIEIKNYNVFFIGFDSLTKQGIEALNNITKSANTAFISITYPTENQPNSNIYDKTFYSSVINMANENNYTIKNIPFKPSTKNIDHSNILNNIFSRKKQFKNNQYLNIYSATTLSEEIDFVVKSINYNIKTKNLNFKDIAISCSSDIAEQIKSKLFDANILAHTDSKTTLLELEPVKYILYTLKYYINPFDKNNLLELIANDFFEGEKEEKEILINLIYQYSSIKTIIKLANLENENINKLINSLNNFKINESDTIQNYIEFIKNNIANQNYFKKLNDFCETLSNKNEIALHKTYLQLENKINTCFAEILDILYDTPTTAKEFLNLLESSFKDTEIAGIPSTINEVLIGDNKSFFGNIKYLYIVGANEGVFPEFLTDSGLISDKEINSDSIKAKLEPTTKIINKRNKFKVLITLLSASEKCFVCYHKIGSDHRPTHPSEFITELKFLLNLNEFEISLFAKYDENNINADKLCFNNINNYMANLNYQLENSNKIQALIRSALIKNNKLFIPNSKQHISINFKELFFKNNKASISLIEQYNSCPKSAFLDRGIKLQRKKLDKIETNTIGSFIHEVAELFVTNNTSELGLLTSEEIEIKVTDICNNIVNKEDYYSIRLDENIFIFQLILKECIRFCSFLNYEQTISKFKPAYPEKKFGDNEEFKPIIIDVDGTKYRISGAVDRIDFCDEDFRVIDYKSGGADFKNLKDGLFYGTKLQLFVYAEAINQNLDKKLFGAFYLPVRNTFTNNKRANYSYSGYFLNSLPLAQKCDSTFDDTTYKSTLLNCAINKTKVNGEYVFRHNDNILTEEQMEHFRKYATKIVINAIRNMQEGYIEASPIKGTCKYCNFRHCCKDANNDTVTRENEFTISNEIFTEFNYE